MTNRKEVTPDRLRVDRLNQGRSERWFGEILRDQHREASGMLAFFCASYPALRCLPCAYRKRTKATRRWPKYLILWGD